MSAIQVQLFGYPTILIDGEPVSGPVTQRHRLALLALLATAPRRTLPREKLFALLWPDAETGNARHLLNTCVHVLRRELADELLVTRRDDVSLADGVVVDVTRFENSVADGKAEDAVALYRSPFLDGFFLNDAGEFDEWSSRERARFSELLRRALESLAIRAESSGDVPASVKWWRILNREDPYNTRVASRLMLALERGGDHGNAIELALEHESLLARDMQAEPPAEFRSLMQRLRDHPNGLVEAPLLESRPEAAAASLDDITRKPASRDTELAIPAATPERSRPRRMVRALAATALVLAAAAFAVWLAAPVSASTILVGDFGTEAGDTALNAAGSELRDLIVREASQWSRIQVVLPEAKQATTSPLSKIVRRRRAGTMIGGSYARIGDSVRFDVRVIDRRNDRVLRVVRTMLPVHRFPDDVMRSCAARVMGALAMVVDERFAAVATPDHTPPVFAAYQDFAIGLELHGDADHAKAIEHFRKAIAADSTFSLAEVWLVRAMDRSAEFAGAESVAKALQARTSTLPEADRFAVNLMLARYRGDTQAAYRAGKALSELTPGSPWLLSYASDAAKLRRPVEAHQVLVALQRRSPWIAEWSEFVSNLGAALHLLGRFSDEHELARRNRHEATNLIVRLIDEARPLAAMGRASEIDLLVQEALATAEQPNLNEGSLMQRIGLELRAHGHVDAANALFVRSRLWYESALRSGPRTPMFSWALGNTLLNLGETDSARAVFLELHRRLPGMYRFHGDLAIVAARKGDLSESSHFDSLLARPSTAWNVFDSAIRVLYRARTAALMGNRGKALELLQAAVAQGVPEAIDSVHINPDLHSLRGLPGFDELTRLRR